MSELSAIVAGGTGLIGSHLLELLGADPAYGKVTALLRRETEVPKGVTAQIINMDDMETAAQQVGATHAFCALGTTRKVAGSKEAFAAVDRDLVIAFAKGARAGGATAFAGVSSIGAASRSPNFYLKTKGEMEDGVRQAAYPSLTFAHPGLLKGKRQESRPGEELGQTLAPLTDLLMQGPLTKYRSITGEAVAKALIAAAKEGRLGNRQLTHRALQKLAAT